MPKNKQKFTIITNIIDVTPSNSKYEQGGLCHSWLFNNQHLLRIYRDGWIFSVAQTTHLNWNMEHRI